MNAKPVRAIGESEIMQIGFILATVVIGNLAFLFEEIRLKTCQEAAEDYKGKCSNREFLTLRLNF